MTPLCFFAVVSVPWLLNLSSGFNFSACCLLPFRVHCRAKSELTGEEHLSGGVCEKCRHLSHSGPSGFYVNSGALAALWPHCSVWQHIALNFAVLIKNVYSEHLFLTSLSVCLNVCFVFVQS